MSKKKIIKLTENQFKILVENIVREEFGVGQVMNGVKMISKLK